MNLSGRAALRREQREKLKSNHPEKWVTVGEGDADHRLHKYSPQKKEMAVRL
jgi:hypothetical protein